MNFTFIATFNEAYISYFNDQSFNINHKFRFVLLQIQGSYLQGNQKSQDVVVILKSTSFVDRISSV